MHSYWHSHANIFDGQKQNEIILRLIKWNSCRNLLLFEIGANIKCFQLNKLKKMDNEFKAGFFMNPSELHRHRLALTQKQLTDFWYSKTLTELQRILSIKDQYLIYNIIFEQYLKYFLNYKKISIGEVFHVMHKEQTLMYVYDAKIFRNNSYDKYQNDLISAYLIAFREKDEAPNDEVFEFLDYGVVEPQSWILKVKESAIMRIFPFIIHRFLQRRESAFESTIRNPIGGYYFSKNPMMNRQVVILDPKIYYFYLYSRIPKYHMSVQFSVKGVFEIVTDLMLNNLLIAWYQSLSEEQKYQRHFKRYFRLIQKPKNKEQFTSIDIRFTEIKQQTFKIPVFKLKYRVKETENHYECYQIDLKSQEQLSEPYDGLDITDQNILKAFAKQRISSPSYDQYYTNFYEV